MPLMKSKSPKAFGDNVKREMDSGKPQKQALAIAYNVKRKAAHKAKGGMLKREMPRDIEADDDLAALAMGGSVEMPVREDKLDERPEHYPEYDAPSDIPDVRPAHFPEHDPVSTAGDPEDLRDLASAIIRKYKAKMYADGGEVADDDALAANAIEMPADMWTHDNHGMKENYSEASALEDLTAPMDSGMHGDKAEEEIEESAADRVRRKAKRK